MRTQYLPTNIYLPDMDKDRISYYESHFGKDVALFTYEEIIGMLKGIGFRSKSSFENFVRVLYLYTAKAINDQFVPSNINFYDTVKQTAVLNRYAYVLPITVQQVFISREELRQLVAENRFDSKMEYITFGFYDGLENEELCELQVGDIDFEQKTVRRGDGTIYPVSDDFLNAVRKHLEDPVRKQKSMPNDRVYYIQGGNLPGKTSIANLIYRNNGREKKIEFGEFKYSIPNLKRSGLFDEIRKARPGKTVFQLCREGDPIVLKVATNRRAASNMSLFNRLYKEYLHDYADIL